LGRLWLGMPAGGQGVGVSQNLPSKRLILRCRSVSGGLEGALQGSRGWLEPSFEAR
jgi:hypothetical protein